MAATASSVRRTTTSSGSSSQATSSVTSPAPAPSPPSSPSAVGGTSTSMRKALGAASSGSSTSSRPAAAAAASVKGGCSSSTPPSTEVELNLDLAHARERGVGPERSCSTTPLSSPIDFSGGSFEDGGVSQGENASSPANGSATTTTLAGKKKKKEKKVKKIFNMSLCKYNVIERLAGEFGFSIDTDEEVENFNFNFIWSDTVLSLQKLVRLANWQRCNHFPSMHLLSRKVHLGLTLGRMRKVYSAHYAFYPRTWSLRSERTQFLKHFQTTSGAKRKNAKIYIMKPNAGSQGNGIILTRDPFEAVSDYENYVVQEYISKPLLIEGKKFDLRVYVLVTSVRHFSAFIYHDGLVRMCAEDYVKPTDDNLSNACIHLTNYAVNKHSNQFVFNTDSEKSDVGNKRDFRFLNQWLKDQGHDPAALWERVEYMICKAFMAALPQMTHVYQSCFPHSNDGYTCFELLGFDIMLDEKLKPWLLEVNHTPSFNCDTPLDRRIKETMLREVWNITGVGNIDRAKHMEKERQKTFKRMMSGPMRNADGTTPASPVTAADAGGGNEGDEPVKTVEQMVAENRAREDTQLSGFKRMYPPVSPERQQTYTELYNAAKELTAVQTTASQEQRQAELKQEREKREQERIKALPRHQQLALLQQPSSSSANSTTTNGTSNSNATSAPSTPCTTTTPSQSASIDAPSALRRAESEGPSTGRSRQGGASGDSNGAGSGATSGDASSSNSARAHRRHSEPPRRDRDGSPLPQRPNRPCPTGASANTATTVPASSDGKSNGASTRRVSNGEPPALGGGVVLKGSQQQQQQQQQQPLPPALSEEALEKRRRRQARLSAQIENHRRRMVLGPRLSVFQLRDTQTDPSSSVGQEDMMYGGQPPEGVSLSTAGGAMHLPPSASSSSHHGNNNPSGSFPLPNGGGGGSGSGGGGGSTAQMALARDAQLLAEYYSSLSAGGTLPSNILSGINGNTVHGGGSAMDRVSSAQGSRRYGSSNSLLAKGSFASSRPQRNRQRGSLTNAGPTSGAGGGSSGGTSIPSLVNRQHAMEPLLNEALLDWDEEEEEEE